MSRRRGPPACKLLAEQERRRAKERRKHKGHRGDEAPVSKTTAADRALIVLRRKQVPFKPLVSVQLRRSSGATASHLLLRLHRHATQSQS